MPDNPKINLLPIEVVEDVLKSSGMDTNLINNLLHTMVIRTTATINKEVQEVAKNMLSGSSSSYVIPSMKKDDINPKLTLEHTWMKVRVFRLTPTAMLPTYGSEGAAARDVYADENLTILPHGGMDMVSTGLVIETPHMWKTEIYARSGMASKGILVSNAPGKVDEDYRGEVKVLLINLGKDPYEIKKGDRIAQMEVNPVNKFGWIEVQNREDLSSTDRGKGGFGSTGK